MNKFSKIISIVIIFGLLFTSAGAYNLNDTEKAKGDLVISKLDTATIKRKGDKSKLQDRYIKALNKLKAKSKNEQLKSLIDYIMVGFGSKNYSVKENVITNINTNKLILKYDSDGNLTKESFDALDKKYNFNQISDLKDGYFALRFTENGNWFIMNTDGYKLEIKGIDDISPLSDGMLIILSNGKYGLIDLKGNRKLAIEYDEIVPSFLKDGNVAGMGTKGKANYKIDRDGNIIDGEIFNYNLVINCLGKDYEFKGSYGNPDVLIQDTTLWTKINKERKNTGYKIYDTIFNSGGSKVDTTNSCTKSIDDLISKSNVNHYRLFLYSVKAGIDNKKEIDDRRLAINKPNTSTNVSTSNSTSNSNVSTNTTNVSTSNNSNTNNAVVLVENIINGQNSLLVKHINSKFSIPSDIYYSKDYSSQFFIASTSRDGSNNIDDMIKVVVLDGNIIRKYEYDYRYYSSKESKIKEHINNESIKDIKVIYFNNKNNFAYNLQTNDGKWETIKNGIKVDYLIGEYKESENGDSYSYTAYKDGKYFVVKDGVEGKKYDSITNITYNKTGTSLSYIAYKDGKVFVVTNGVEGNMYDGISNLIFNETGTSFAYLARTNIQNNDINFVVKDGIEGKKYNTGIGNITYSKDGKTLYYQTNNLILNFQNDILFQITLKYDSYSGLKCSSDFKSCSYIGHNFNDGSYYYIIKDGVELYKSSISIDPRNLIYSDNGNSFSYIGFDSNQNGGYFIVKNGVKLNGLYSQISSVTYSPNGDSITYLANKIIIKDGVELSEGDSFIYNKDGTSFVYIGYKDGKHFVVKDGIKGKEYDLITDLIYSNDGKEISYRGVLNNKDYIIKDGKEYSLKDNFKGLDYTK